jgi:hypothetical protein
MEHMNRQSMVAALIALVLVAAAVGTILYSTRENRVRLEGEVLKVRSHQMDSEHTIALIDVRLKNPSTQQFVVREIEVFVEEPDGKSTASTLFAEGDARRVIDYYKQLGKKHTPGLLRKDMLGSGETTDRSFAISAPMPDERLAQRKAIRIVIRDVDGATTEILERR